MKAFLMHIGANNSIDLDYTVKIQRSISETASGIPKTASEYSYFTNSNELKSVFPSGQFNCWGVPSAANPSFQKTEVGDVVLFIPHIGAHSGGVKYMGIVKHKCPVRAEHASRILWPKTPEDRIWPLLFFFDTEEVERDWFSFLDDLGYAPNWTPRGWYRQIAPHRFSKYDGVAGYINLLRTKL